MEHEAEHFEVEVALLPSSETSRKTPIASGYRPNHRHPLTGEYFMGQLSFSGLVAPGETTHAQLRVVASPGQIAALKQFGSWTIWEGPHHVGSVRIIG